MAFISRLINTSRLSKVLLVRILLFSGLFTLMISAVQLSLNYQSETEELQTSSQHFVENNIPFIAKAMFEFNHEQANNLAIFLMRLALFQSITITDENMNTVVSLGEKDDNMRQASHNLQYELEKKTIYVGTLEYQTNTNRVKQKIMDDVIIIFISQFVKTFFVSLFILFIIHSLVIRHLNEISNWLKRFKPNSSFTPLILETDKGSDNEMIHLKSAISEMGQQVHKHTSELEKLVAERTAALEKLAYTDSLTGVSNRGAFFQASNDEINRSRRLSYDIGVMMIDLDHFKSINDTYGHDAGDKVLKQVSQAMNNCLRKEDTLGRIGGEEFAIITPGADKKAMHKLALRLQQSIAVLCFSFLPEEHNITVSIGYTKVSKDEDFKVALKRADKHLYTAKASGRNTFVTDKEFASSIVN